MSAPDLDAALAAGVPLYDPATGTAVVARPRAWSSPGAADLYLVQAGTPDEVREAMAFGGRDRQADVDMAGYIRATLEAAGTEGARCAGAYLPEYGYVPCMGEPDVAAMAAAGCRWEPLGDVPARGRPDGDRAGRATVWISLHERFLRRLDGGWAATVPGGTTVDGVDVSGMAFDAPRALPSRYRGPSWRDVPLDAGEPLSLRRHDGKGAVEVSPADLKRGIEDGRRAWRRARDERRRQEGQAPAARQVRTDGRAHAMTR